jgi:hypothetical protein
VTVVVASCALFAGGCQQPAERLGWHGQTPVLASYQGQTLVSALPSGARVPSAVAAADQALESSGYTVTARETTTHLGRVVARVPDRRLGRIVTIDIAGQGDGSVVEIRMDPGGNENASRDLLERMLTRLGL